MNKTINQLTNLAEVSSSDELPIWDNSAGDTKKVSVENLGKEIIKEFNTYSTTERFTGKYWIDGKPIYEIVVEFTSPVSVYQQWGNLLTIANVNQVISVNVLEYRSGENWTIPCMGRYINGTIQGQSNNGGSYSTTAILEYTKSTT